VRNNLEAKQARTATDTTTNAAATITSHTIGVNLLVDPFSRGNELYQKLCSLQGLI